MGGLRHTAHHIKMRLGVNKKPHQSGLFLLQYFTKHKIDIILKLQNQQLQLHTCLILKQERIAFVLATCKF